MQWMIFVRREERELFKLVRQSLVQSVSTFIWLQGFAYLMCLFLFHSNFSLAENVTYTLIMFLVSGLIYTHNHYGRKKKLWSEKRSPSQAVYVTMFYLALGYFWWSFYIIQLLYASPKDVSLIIVIAGIVGAFAISLMGVFERVFALVIVVTVALELVVMWILFRAEARPYIFQILALGLFHAILLHIHNSKLISSLRMKELNVELVQELERKNLELGQSNLSQSRYLSAASHDLRQPLHALALIADDIHRKNNNSNIEFSLNRMKQAIESLSKSFDAMLNLSRLDAGVIKPNIQNFPIQRLLERLVIEYESTAIDKGLSFTVVNSKLWVRADEGILYSILSNLVANAVRYTEKGGVIVGVRWRGSHCMPVIYDTGVGIPEEKVQQIFEEYQRLDYARQRVIGGVGLGLSISERMAKLLDTKLIVKSRLNRGSAFGLNIPCVEVEFPLQQAESNQSMVGQDYLFGKKAIILDDDAMAIEELDELLTSWGMDVSIVLSYEMLEELVELEGEVDLILSDFHLGLARENGLDILQQGRVLHKQKMPHCVLITGDTTADLVEYAQAAKVHLLHKPVSPARLRAFLNVLLKDAAKDLAAD